MNGRKTDTLENRISLFRNRLDTLLNTKPIDSRTVLKLSRKLDVLIDTYYTTSKKVKQR